jgi:hypothetical protein
VKTVVDAVFEMIVDDEGVVDGKRKMMRESDDTRALSSSPAA